MRTLAPKRLKGGSFAHIFAVLLLAGCAEKNAQGQAPQTGKPQSRAELVEPEAVCATGDASQAGVLVSNTDHGVALTFITSEDDIANLRARVRHMADVNNRGSGDAQPMARQDPHDDTYRMGAGARAMNASMPQQQEGLHTMQGGAPGPRPYFGTSTGSGSIPSTATVEDIDGGARLVLTPKQSSQLAALRERVQAHVRRIQETECELAAAKRKQTAEEAVGQR
jgi:hypothetical protein